MKKLLIILSNYRISEKIIPVIPELSKHYKLYLYMIGQFSIKTKWPGNIDPRIKFINWYEHYFDNYHIGHKFQSDERCDTNLFKMYSPSYFDGVIFDDNRLVPEIQMPQIYQQFKKHDIPVIGNSHGNQDFRLENLSALGKTYDYVFVLGIKEKIFYSQTFQSNKLLAGGIPSNDILGKMEYKPNYILLIINFLGNRSAPFPIKFDKTLIEKIGIIKLAREYDLPILVKNKARHDDQDYKKNVEYIRSWFDRNIRYSIITDGNNDELIMNSKIVISAPSTFAFKSIQAGIPTILIKNSGQTGNFYDFDGLVDLESENIINSIKKQIEKRKDEEFILNTIEGGLDFNSIDIYINRLRKLI